MPQVGVRFRKLSGIDIGRVGTVLESPAPPPLPSLEFLARMDGDPPEVQMRILPRDIVEPFPFSEPPEWAAPISLADASDLDTIVVDFCNAGRSRNGWNIHCEVFYRVISSIWRMRIPITPNELWRVLHAHGVPDTFEIEIIDFFSKGRDLLVCTHGRKPIKKKRVEPFST